MATQTVHFGIGQGPDGTDPWSGTLTATPVDRFNHPVAHTDESTLIVPEPVTVTVSAGEATETFIESDLTGAGGVAWLWMFESKMDSAFPTRYVHIAAASGTVEFTDLPQIALSTMSPSVEPEAAWTAALAALQAEVDALGTGLPTGGTTGQALVKNSSTDGDVVWGDVSVSAASTTAQGIVELATNTETITGADTARATTPAGVAAAIAAAVANLIASAPGALDTLDELAAALGDDANFAATITTALAAKAADSAVVHLTGNETVAGTKTFSSAPAVPDASFAIAKTSGLQTALDGKTALTAVLTQAATLVAALGTNVGIALTQPYTDAASEGRPAGPADWPWIIIGGTTTDTDPASMITNDFRIATTA